jgi:hypothetical protein
MHAYPGVPGQEKPGDGHVLGLLAKLSPSLDPLWVAYVTGGGMRHTVAASPCDDQGIYLCGCFHDFVACGGLGVSANPQDVFVAKMQPSVTSNRNPVLLYAKRPGSVCLTGYPQTFSAVAEDPDGDPLTFTWHMGDGTVLVGDEVTHTYTQSGADIHASQFRVHVCVSDGKGHGDYGRFSFSVYPGLGDGAPFEVEKLEIRRKPDGRARDKIVLQGRCRFGSEIHYLGWIHVNIGGILGALFVNPGDKLSSVGLARDGRLKLLIRGRKPGKPIPAGAEADLRLAVTTWDPVTGPYLDGVEDTWAASLDPSGDPASLDLAIEIEGQRFQAEGLRGVWKARENWQATFKYRADKRRRKEASPQTK